MTILWNNWGIPVVENCYLSWRVRLFQRLRVLKQAGKQSSLQSLVRLLRFTMNKTAASMYPSKILKLTILLVDIVILLGLLMETPANESADDCYYDSSQTWSFLKIETSKGSIWQRWLGESNGYYSESVDILGGSC